MVKIGSVTAEIFVIWTNVVRTNVAWTNGSMSVGISSRCVQELTFKIGSVTGEILLTLSLCGVVVVVVGWGAKSL